MKETKIKDGHMVTITIIKLLQNARAGLNKACKSIYQVYASKEPLEEIKKVELRKELRMVRKQLKIVEDELI